MAHIYRLRAWSTDPIPGDASCSQHSRPLVGKSLVRSNCRRPKSAKELASRPCCPEEKRRTASLRYPSSIARGVNPFNGFSRLGVRPRAVFHSEIRDVCKEFVETSETAFCCAQGSSRTLGTRFHQEQLSVPSAARPWNNFSKITLAIFRQRTRFQEEGG